MALRAARRGYRRHQRGCGAGAAAPRVVVCGGARDRATAGRAQSGQRCADEPARKGGRQLALAVHRKSAVGARVRIAARVDARFVAVHQPRHCQLFSTRRHVARDDRMKATTTLQDQGQSIWLDNITRDLLQNGTLARYIAELSVTGLTSNPTIFDHAIKNSTAYDAAIQQKVREGKSGEALFFELALEDLTRAADLFRPIWDQTHGVDGWVSLEVSPLLAHDTTSTLAAAKELHARAARPNLLIKIPGTTEGLPAIEEAIFAGIPINVTLLFSDKQYLAAAEAFIRGIERRLAAGLDPQVDSVGSVFISRWDTAVARTAPAALRNQPGIAIPKRTHKAYRPPLPSGPQPPLHHP